MRRTMVLALASVAVSAVGCGGDPDERRPPPADLRVDGDYQIVSAYDLTVGAVLPQPVASYGQTLVALRRDPGATLFLLLERAGVPLADDLLGAVPDVVESQLEGWINEYVFARTVGGASVGSELDALVAALESVLTRFDVASDLSLPALDAQGTAVATHGLEELRYRLYGGTVEVVVPIVAPPGAGSLVMRETTAAARVTAGRAGEDAVMSLGDHGFGLPYGTYALQAIEQAAQQRYGQDLRGALGLLIDCAGMAASVARRCVLGVCVGHQAELAAVCDAGLDLVEDDIRARVGALRFEALRLAQGDAQMWDAPAAGGPTDRRIDRLSAGTWRASIDFGMGARSVPATFSGTRGP